MDFASFMKRCACVFCALSPALASVAAATPLARAATGTQTGTTAKASLVAASLAQCTPAASQAERSATFAGEMSSIPGAARMEIRIEVLERLPSEAEFHRVAAPGLGDWRQSVGGVRAYKYLKQVTNLSAPAEYRAAVRFRWLNARGRILRVAQMPTAVCSQFGPEPALTPPGNEAPAPAS